MSQVLRYTVIVRHPDTTAPTALLVGQPVPEWAKDLVHPDDLDTGGAESASQEKAVAPAEPARAGRGSGLEAWAGYARGLGIEVPEDATRDDVIALVDQHNH